MLSVSGWAQEDDLGPQICGPPPPPKPARRKAAESYPPLPLPVVPLRRTEKKRPPAPPVLVGKLQYGQRLRAIAPDGREYFFWDWNSDPGDLEHLFGWVNPRLGVRFRHENFPLAQLSAAVRVPAVYLHGHLGFTLTEQEVKGLREYLLAGGTLFANAGCGNQQFIDAFRREIVRVFPEKTLFRLPPDHPLYHAFYLIEEVTFRPAVGIPQGRPVLEGINLGCRTAVFFTPFDVACGWDGHSPESNRGYSIPDARRLGTNFIAYLLQYRQLSRYLAQPKVVLTGATEGHEFVFAQIVHQGDWNPDERGVTNLLQRLARETNLRVAPQPKPIVLEEADLFDYPFLYLTGHRDFQFSEAAVKKLRRYLQQGGFLLADSCCGRLTFDAAFRREIARVLPNVPLTPLPPNHPVYGTHYTLRQVAYTPEVEGQTGPTLEGITLGGHLAVVYSKYDLGCGWEQFPCPFCRGYKPATAFQLGVNAIVYALTH